MSARRDDGHREHSPGESAKRMLQRQGPFPGRRQLGEGSRWFPARLFSARFYRHRLRVGTGFVRLGAVFGGAGLAGWTAVVHAASEAASVEGLNPLQSWRGDLALWTAVVFLVLLAVLGKYAWGPILRALQQREQTIADQIAQAQRRHQEAQDLLAQYQQKLAQSQQEVQHMLEEARRQAEQTGRQILQQAHQQAEADRKKMLQEMERAKVEALRELTAEAAALAVHLAGKILQTELRPERHQQLIRQTLAEWEAPARLTGNQAAASEQEDRRR